jgi:hypothetical protein
VSPGGGIAFASSFALGRVIAIHPYPEQMQKSLFIARRQCRATMNEWWRRRRSSLKISDAADL